MFRATMFTVMLLSMAGCDQIYKANYPSVQIVDSDGSSLWGDTVRATVHNTGAGGNVLIYLIQDDFEVCVRQTYMAKDERRKIRIQCPLLEGGKFEIATQPQSLAPKNVKARARGL